MEIYLVRDFTGLTHVISALIALLMGTIVLLKPKGTAFHKVTGYLYIISMAIMLITAFMIYRLYNSFGLFHWFAVYSSLTLLVGIFAVLLNRKSPQHIMFHLSLMYWSVIGLYAAFFAELLTRIPPIMNKLYNMKLDFFYPLVIIAIFITIGIGTISFIKIVRVWQKRLYE